MAFIETIGILLIKLVIFAIKAGIIYAILVTCHHGIEDERQGSVNQRSPSVQLTIALLFLCLTLVGIYGVLSHHLGLFLTWFFLRPVVYILDLEDKVWTAIAMALIASGGTISYVTYESVAALSQALV